MRTGGILRRLNQVPQVGDRHRNTPHTLRAAAKGLLDPGAPLTALRE
jgi:hypothetical protein